ncbi:MAG: MMPL family transporter, partial [Flavobacteriaceae bacterium]|nr:MMPL family transporter [Flavobacteriaceae bacterium]
FWVPLILFTPTLFGALLSIAVLYLLRGQISAISLGIGSVLLGVTLDYSLHILTHLRNNSDVKELYADVSRPILMSSLTTALAFLCLWFVNSQALQDLGIFAACSVIGASIFSLLFIPTVYKGNKISTEKRTLLDRWAAYPLHRNKFLIIGLSILLVLSCFTYGKVDFNNDISKLNYEPEFLKAAKTRLDALTDIGSKSVYIATFSEITETALQKNDQVLDSLQHLKNKNEIISFSSVGALVQSKAKQQAKIDRWNSFWKETGIDSLKMRLITSGNEFNFKSSTFQLFYEHLSNDFDPISLEGYRAIDWFALDDFITVKNKFTTVTTLVKVKEGSSEPLSRAFEDDPAIMKIDRQQMNESLLGNLKNDFNTLIGYSLIVVLVLLLLFYRSFSLMLVTSIPIGLSWLLTIGMMGLFQIEFNIFNIIISTFIFGLGVDYSIFITNGLLKEYKDGTPTLATHKTSVILSVITTLFGIGILIFAQHPALYTISVVCMIGIFSAMLISFVIQPLLFRLLIGSKNKRPITLRLLLHSSLSFGYYGLGGFILSLLSVSLMKVMPISKKKKMNVFHRILSKFMKSVLYTNPFVKKRIINNSQVDFSKPAILIANHTSFLDILAVGMLHPKIIFLVNDWVYNSPIFGKAVQLAGFYPVSGGIDKGVEHLRKKVEQGYCLMAFPEGTRSTTNKIKRFHKGSFHLAEMLDLDIIPILIHGNSEVLPKGSFVIKDGSITVKILPRIPAESTRYGTSSREKTKKIGSYFRAEFQQLRDEIEGVNYFHSTLLEEYRYKGDKIFRSVKDDLKQNRDTYFSLLSEIDKNATILHVSGSLGQLDFLLALDGPQRKIISYIDDKETVNMLDHSFLTHTDRKIQFLNSIKPLKDLAATTLIIDDFELTLEITQIWLPTATTLIVIGDLALAYESKLLDFGFKVSHQQKNLSIFKKTT